MTNYMSTQRKAIDAFANLNQKGMLPRPEAAPWEKHAPTAPIIASAPAANSASAPSYRKSGQKAQAPISVRAAQLADNLPILPAHEADALDDRFLWEFLGDKSERESKRAAYRRMMERRNIVALTPEGIAQCCPTE